MGARFLQASTSEVYGDPEVHPQVESYWGYVNPTGPRACYDEGKRAAETLIFDYARASRARSASRASSTPMGRACGADDGRVVSNVVTQALAGDDITIYGEGEQTRSFCYVDDLIDGLLRLMAYEGDYFGAINLGNPSELTVRELVTPCLASYRLATRGSSAGRCLSTTRNAGAPTSGWPRACWTGRRASRWSRDCRRRSPISPRRPSGARIAPRLAPVSASGRHGGSILLLEVKDLAVPGRNGRSADLTTRIPIVAANRATSAASVSGSPPIRIVHD